MAIDDYTADTPADAVASVADAIRSSHRLAPLTEEQKLLRRAEIEVWQEYQRCQSEQRRIERERQQAEAEAVARQEAAIERAEANRKARLERSAEIERRTKEIELNDLRMQVNRQASWQRDVDSAARNAVAMRRRQALLAEFEQRFNPPAPPPEPEVIYVERDMLGSSNCFDENYNPNYWHDKFWGKWKSGK